MTNTPETEAETFKASAEQADDIAAAAVRLYETYGADARWMALKFSRGPSRRFFWTLVAESIADAVGGAK